MADTSDRPPLQPPSFNGPTRFRLGGLESGRCVALERCDRTGLRSPLLRAGKRFLATKMSMGLRISHNPTDRDEPIKPYSVALVSICDQPSARE